MYSQTRIANLTKGTMYEVKVQGASRSLNELSKVYRGDFSTSRKVILQSKCISKFYPLLPANQNHFVFSTTLSTTSGEVV